MPEALANFPGHTYRIDLYTVGLMVAAKRSPLRQLPARWWTQDGVELVLGDPAAALTNSADLAELHTATATAARVSWGTTTLHLHRSLDRKLWRLVLDASVRAATTAAKAANEPATDETVPRK